MRGEKDKMREMEKTVAAVCGLYCEACSWFIATTEDRERLRTMAAQRNWSEEEGTCHGCRAGKRLPYCEKCTMSACAEARGIDFCRDCDAYPCDDLRQFQSAMPHRIELWKNLDRIKSAGFRQWLEEVRENYVCPQCGAVNSAYDITCRKCGSEPSCKYVADNRHAIEEFLKHR